MVDTIREPHKVKVRKTHVCQGCGKKIEKCQEAISSTYAEAGDIWTFYECQECAKYRDIHCTNCKDYNYCIGESYDVGTIKTCKKESSK